ncbi:hypothetical protein CC78DRAFT_567026 [Lojkania enalia]|uniref:Small ribosomal subunit protein mS29 n=1 Tax=Lojkania enalia TaxID=147567 RepID=A0A9P4KEI0_9PLEO|nr:hypothetical protein CC78DRAFT_567026 [Didymosphaeria enalia]
MSSSTCLRRFAKSSLERAVQPSIASRSLISPQASCFSTSAPRHALPTLAKASKGPPPKKGSTLILKKKKAPAKAAGRPPAPGDRKAMRKRIVLSNNNALEVAGLQDLKETDALSGISEGQVKGLPEDVVDALRAMEAFKTNQGWKLFRRPATLIRKETTELAGLLKQAEEEKKTVRRVFIGDRMSGKSTLLLQSLSMGFLRNWVVINLPEAYDIVNAHTEYKPLPGSHPTQYTQDVYTANFLSQIVKANKSILENTQITTNPSLPLPLPAKASLKQLAELGIANVETSWPVFVALWKELTQPGLPPVMLALDGLAHAMRNSEYLSAQVKPIHAHDLTIIRHFVDHLSGKATLPNGGAILAATTSSNNPRVPAFEFSMQVAEAKRYHPDNIPQWNPYKNVDQRVIECLKDVEVLKLNGLSKEEARSIMEYYAASGMLRAKVDDKFVTEKWSLAGMGNIGELERAAVRLRI